MTTAARERSLDCVGGIMIVSVILTHCLIFNPWLRDSLIGRLFYYSFGLCMMPWFFFKGGMFYKDEPLPKVLTKGLSRLMIPYFIISILSELLMGLTIGATEGEDGLRVLISNIPKYLKAEGAVIENPALWFLPSLFLVRLFYSLSRSWRIPKLLVFFIALACSFTLYRINLPIGLYFENIALGLAYYVAGDILRVKQYTNNCFYLSLVLCPLFIIYGFLTNSISGSFNNNSYTPFFLTIAYSLLGCCLLNNIFQRTPLINVPVLSELGKSSMSYYVFHFLIIGLLVYLNTHYFHCNNHILFVILVLVLAITLPLLTKIFSSPALRWAIGEYSWPSCPLGQSRIVNGITQLLVAVLALMMIIYEVTIGVNL